MRSSRPPASGRSNILGFCIGGILTAAALAYLTAKGDDRISSATFLATLFDFEDVGEVAVFIDDEQLAQMEKHIADKGYLEGHHMADMFNMMRENDLIWSFVVNNYLMGREPPPFDLLYWNAGLRLGCRRPCCCSICARSTSRTC